MARDKDRRAKQGGAVQCRFAMLTDADREHGRKTDFSQALEREKLQENR